MAPTIALDAMGGDHAPQCVIDGAARAARRDSDLRFILFGDRTKLSPLLDKRKRLSEVCTLEHTDDQIADDTRPSVALRQGRQSSMRRAIDALKSGDADAMISAGNTGALMAMGKVVLRTLPRIDRPAIVSTMPTRRGRSVMLDLGANATCNPNNLVEFAVMGEVFARAVLGVERPSVGLLNIGSEDVKGHDVVQEAAQALREGDLPIDFAGFIEANEIHIGRVDVVVTDGFTGNVALKMAEGTATFIGSGLKEAFASSWRGRLSYLLGKPMLERLRRSFDPRGHNGAMFVGLNGVVVKSHGNTDALGYANAIRITAELIRNGTNTRIIEEMERFGVPSHLAAAS